MAAKISRFQTYYFSFGFYVVKMTLSLLSLSQNEHEIYKRTQQQLNSNVATEADWQADKLILDNYKAIHREYLRVFLESDDEATKLEALKRLVFLNWNLIVETDWLTGIDDLDEAVILGSYTILNNYMKQGKFDVEFAWMLSHYAVWDYAILQFVENKLPELTQFVNTIDISKKKFPTHLPAGTFENRGQMGIYWELMIKTDA
ncbi:hypothetical protein [Mucilaginibacter psychrotolerans]|uniref:Uncharacterized protein n=1 Tax=Mucilaginibacter psychrotolerans TaxID=1524096 RepID=A0A4Y8SNG0_9SPHI|nr:hypothetical protein [Mucilaginibacter psychrotolerans]TFF40372.1 hypothetical protein E2R66_03745 [Mucilaginibacter psychrotolerans]